MKTRRSRRAAVLLAVGAVWVCRPGAGLGQEAGTAGPLPGTRSPEVAFAVAAAGTAIPMLVGYSRSNGGGDGLWLTLGGLIVGPSLGDLYAGSSRRAIQGILARGSVMGLTALLVTGVCSTDSSCGLFSSDDGAIAVAMAVATAGAAATVALAVHEIVTTDDRARARNARLASRVTLLPIVDPVGRGAGLAFRLRF